MRSKKQRCKDKAYTRALRTGVNLPGQKAPDYKTYGLTGYPAEKYMRRRIRCVMQSKHVYLGKPRWRRGKTKGFYV